MIQDQRAAAIKDPKAEWEIPDVGTIPSSWKVSRLGYVATVKARLGWKGLKAEEYLDDGFALLSTPNIKGEHEIDFENVNYISRQRYLESPEIIIESGDVLLAKDGSTLGIVNAVRGLPKPSTVNSSIAVIRPNAILVNSLFLFRWLTSAFIQETIALVKDGQGVPHLFQEDIRKFRILLPPLANQIAIADFLDKETSRIDALIFKKERQIELLQEKRQAIITRAVTKGLDPNAKMKDSGVEWIGSIPNHWEEVDLRRRWLVIDCKHKTAVYTDEGYPVISTTEVKPGRLSLQTERRTTEKDYLDLIGEGRKPQKGDLIYSRNASLGVASYVDTDEPFCMGQDVCLVKSSKESQLFLMYFLNSSVAKHQLKINSVGSTFSRINVEQIKQLVICRPPLSEQLEIAAFIDSRTAEITDLVNEISKSIDLLFEYRSSLITAAVSGQIDVSKLTNGARVNAPL